MVDEKKNNSFVGKKSLVIERKKSSDEQVLVQFVGDVETGHLSAPVLPCQAEVIKEIFERILHLFADVLGF